MPRQVVLFVLGLLLLGLGVLMLVPALLDALVHDFDWKVFLVASAMTIFAGGALVFGFRPRGEIGLTLREAFVLTAASWVTVSMFSALPFLMSNLRIDFVDAFFEAVSGVTTTGSTVITDLDLAPPGILLWRAMLQWIGGVGIIVTAIAILPYLRVGGMQLFRTESSDRSEKILPRAAALASSLGMIYMALTALCAFALAVAGMTPFEAICHAMTTVATGGYSTMDASIGAFDSVAIEAIVTLFMILGSLTFVLYIRSVRGDVTALIRDSQVRWFLTVVVVAAIAVALWTWSTGTLPIATAFRHAIFNVTSIVTTTGFSSADYGQWGNFAIVVFLFITFIGGCTGSTSGGIKIFRFQVLFAMARVKIMQIVQPHRVVVPTFNDAPIDDEIMISVLSFLALWGFSCIVATMALAAFDLDILTSLSGAAQALANVGPGLGAAIGPAGNYASLPDGAKIVLSAAMLLGRLEIMALLVLFVPAFWKD